MNKSPIEIFISKVASGEHSYMERLCAQLADRLVYVPLAAPVRNQGSKTTITAFTMHQGNRSVVPVFTSESKFKNWCFEEGHNDASFSVLGADLCAVLDSTSWIVLDPLDSVSVELNPEAVAMVAASVQALPTPATSQNSEPQASVIPATATPSAVERAGASAIPAAAVAQGPVLANPLIAPVPPAPAANSTRTIIFSSSNVLAEQAPAAASMAQPQRSSSGAQNSPGGKKRSFLNFLKTGR
jgi:hypothetical protein